MLVHKCHRAQISMAEDFVKGKMVKSVGLGQAKRLEKKESFLLM